MQIGEYALLRVTDVNDVGTFLDWGQPKDLFLPHAERTHELRVGDEIIVFTYLDKTGRTSASMRIERNKTKSTIGLSERQKVELIIADETDIGFKAIVNRQTIGVIFHNEIFQPLEYGQHIDGYIKQIREDGRLDLILHPEGHKAAVEGIGPKILQMLDAEGGFSPINDKTDADTIYSLFGVSKNKYKLALGGLFKNRQITISKDGIRLVKKPYATL